jgi:dTDP-4-dehydrorhamnose reductase
MKIFIFGSNGMLGRYVKTYLTNFFEVVEINRDKFNVSNCSEQTIEDILIQNNIKNGDVIINCIGTIKPRVDELGELNAIIVNSVFPRYLANVCEKLNSNLIHPTTDCVFDGLKGDYNENDEHDVTDVYGRTKSLGEPSNCTVIRTSIIGEELNQGRSLVEWVKSNKNKEINGFTNHIWNGMTCLQFAKICKLVIDDNLFWKGTKHIFSNKVNKFELLSIINEVYQLNIKINNIEANVLVDRSMSSIHEGIFTIPNLYNQITEMSNFKLS